MKVKVIKANLDSYWYSDKVGEVFEVEQITLNNHEKFTYRVVNSESQGCLYFDHTDVEIINEEKVMKREDKINIEMTLQDVAWLYAISARANGSVGFSIYRTLKSMVDPDGDAYHKFIDGKFNLFDYRAVQEDFEAEIFDRKTPEQKQLDIVMDRIAELQTQAAELQKLVNK